MFSASLPRNIYRRNASHTTAGEQGGVRLGNGFEPKCLLHRLPASLEFVADTGRQLGLRGHACHSFVLVWPGSLINQSIYLSPGPPHVQILGYCLLLRAY